MDQNRFNQLVDDALADIETALERLDIDLDWDLADGILSIVCGDDTAHPGSKVIINRQGPSQQIWVAARSGGYHFAYHAADDTWRQGDLELFALLSRALSEQCGALIDLNRVT